MAITNKTVKTAATRFIMIRRIRVTGITVFALRLETNDYGFLSE
jgi:hypothetical protein